MERCPIHEVAMKKSKYHSLYCPTCMDEDRTKNFSHKRTTKVN